MSILMRIAHFQGRKDEVPNRELARMLVETQDHQGIQEIADALHHQDLNVQNDCIKVLYEVGYLKPEWVAGYAEEFIKLIGSRHNRQVWGGMLALSTIAGLAADEIFPHSHKIIKAMDEGSVITVDNGVKVLAILASKNQSYAEELVPYLLRHLGSCRPKDVAQHAESCQAVMVGLNKDKFLEVLNARLDDLSAAQLARVKKVIR